MFNKFYYFHRTRWNLISRGLHWSYAEKNGYAVLKTEINWRKINGIIISTPNWALWLFFRRFRDWRY